MTQTPDWRAQKWAATHRRIYDAAIALFQEHGYEKVSVGQIAARAGVSVPTFYAHYPSKEHVVMRLPTPEDVQAIIAMQPADLPRAERLRRAAPLWVATWSDEMREEALTRWKVIAGTPALRLRAAEFERTTAGMIADALPTRSGAAPRPSDDIMINAYLAAYTAGLLAWADSDGQRKVEELIEESFEALHS